METEEAVTGQTMRKEKKMPDEIMSAETPPKNKRTMPVAVLKYVAAAAIVGYVALLLLNISGSTKPFDEVKSAVENSLNTENLTEQGSQALKRYYGLNSEEYDGVLYYSSEFSISAEEVLLVCVKDDSQVQEVREAAEARIEDRLNDFEGYAPEEVQLLEEARLLVRGKYIFLAVAPEADVYADVFATSL